MILEFTYFEFPSYTARPKFLPVDDTIGILNTESSKPLGDQTDDSIDNEYQHTDSLSEDEDWRGDHINQFRDGGHLMSKFNQFEL